MRYGYISLILFALSPGYTPAAVLTFDDLPPLADIPGNSENLALIPQGYGGFNWTNMFYLNALSSPDSGAPQGAVSGDYLAFNGNGDSASLDGQVFDFTGAYFASAWNDSLSLNIEAYAGTSLVQQATLTLNTTEAIWFQADYTGITRLVFESSGGYPHAGYSGRGTQFTMDNFTYYSPVPLPPAVLLFGSGLLVLFGTRRRRRST